MKNILISSHKQQKRNNLLALDKIERETLKKVSGGKPRLTVNMDTNTGELSEPTLDCD